MVLSLFIYLYSNVTSLGTNLVYHLGSLLFKQTLLYKVPSIYSML